MNATKTAIRVNPRISSVFGVAGVIVKAIIDKGILVGPEMASRERVVSLAFLGACRFNNTGNSPPWISIANIRAEINREHADESADISEIGDLCSQKSRGVTPRVNSSGHDSIH